MANILDQSEIDSALKMFNEFDIDNNGYVDRLEISVLLKRIKSQYLLIELGYQMSDNEILRIFNDFDEDSNGKITFEEFLKVLYCAKNANADDNDIRIFLSFLRIGILCLWR